MATAKTTMKPRTAKRNGNGAVMKLPPPPPAGAYSHMELYSDAPDETKRFYSKVFGWKFSDVSYGPGMRYAMYETPKPPNGGLMQRRPGAFQPPSVLTYLFVKDVEKTAKAIVAGGGKLLVPKYEVPNVGSFVIFEAPGGIIQAAWQNAKPQ